MATRDALREIIVGELVGVRGDPFDVVIERGEAEVIADRVLAVLVALGEELESEYEQVGTWWHYADEGPEYAWPPDVQKMDGAETVDVPVFVKRSAS